MVYRVDIFDGEQLQDFFVRMAGTLDDITIDEALAWRGAFTAYFQLAMEYGAAWLKKEGLVDFTTAAWELYKQLEWMIELYANDFIGYIWDVVRVYDACGDRLFQPLPRRMTRQELLQGLRNEALGVRTVGTS